MSDGSENGHLDDLLPLELYPTLEEWLADTRHGEVGFVFASDALVVKGPRTHQIGQLWVDKRAQVLASCSDEERPSKIELSRSDTGLVVVLRTSITIPVGNPSGGSRVRAATMRYMQGIVVVLEDLADWRELINSYRSGLGEARPGTKKAAVSEAEGEGKRAVA